MDDEKKNVITIRILESLDETLKDISKKRRITKANLIRNYLELANYILVDQNSMKSLNDVNLLVLKRSFFYKIVEGFAETDQIDLGQEYAQFINDLARREGKIDDIDYKLDICENFGLFVKNVDKENYILFSKEFAPEKFVEAFVFFLITKGDDGEFKRDWVTDKMKSNKSLTQAFNKKIMKIERDASYYSFEFAKIPEEEPK